MELRDTRIAVTGATGFLGRYVADALLRRGARVIGVVRNPERVPALAARGVEMRRADLGSREALARGFAGAAAIVSNAALFSLRTRNVAAHDAANIRGTENVFRAAADAGVRRLVHVSSVAVYAGRGDNTAEDAPRLTAESPRTFSNTYALSKAISEERAWALAREHGIALTCVRPCAIYGAFDQNFTAVLAWLMRLPVAPLPTLLRLALVYAGDVAEGVAGALAADASAGQAYNTTGEASPFDEFVAAWREAGGPSPWVTIPIPVPLTVTYDHSRAARDIGFRNRTFGEALRETFALERAENGR